MKMVSQLTRQAMNRHRLLSGSVAQPAYPEQPPAAEPVSAPSAGAQPVRTLYAQPPAPVPQAAPLQEYRPAAARIAAAEPPHHSIYSQLMLKHDRMSERHLSKT